MRSETSVTLLYLALKRGGMMVVSYILLTTGNDRTVDIEMHQSKCANDPSNWMRMGNSRNIQDQWGIKSELAGSRRRMPRAGGTEGGCLERR